MSSNRIYNCLANLDWTMPTTKRTKIFVSGPCNMGCVFCYFKDRNLPIQDFSHVKNQIDFAYNVGCRDLEFTGGEPTLDPRLKSYIEYAKNEFEYWQIALISNGWKLADFDYFKELKEAGLNEVLFSLHGVDKQTHENITQKDGSFERILKAIENSNKLGILTRINCTVCQLQIERLEEHASLLSNFDITCVNYLPLNYWEDNINSKYQINYHLFGEKMMKTLDLLDVKYKTVRYFPYCFMKGYEEYLCNHYHHIFDYFDWLPALETFPEINHSLTLKEVKNMSKIIADNTRIYSYEKLNKCNECKYRVVCDGIKKPFKDVEVFPIQGELITDPMFARKHYTERKYLDTIW